MELTDFNSCAGFVLLRMSNEIDLLYESKTSCDCPHELFIESKAMRSTSEGLNILRGSNINDT